MFEVIAFALALSGDHVRISCNGYEASGFAVSASEIVTADHAARDARCTIGAGSRLDAVSSERENDMTTLRSRARQFTPVRISCDGMQTGQTYTVVGAKGLFDVVATDRFVTTVDPEYGVRYVNMRQTVGVVPVGASGGPVHDATGQVVGFVSSGTATHTFVKELTDTEICVTNR